MYGVLFSQMGYELGDKARIIYRSSEANGLSDEARVQLVDREGSHAALSESFRYWGCLWGSHWWSAELLVEREGEYLVQVYDKDELLHERDGLRVAEDVLWQSSWRHASYGMLEPRGHLGAAEYGWQDAGAQWQESNSHASMVIGLCDVLENAATELTSEDRASLEAEVLSGCRYLALCQDEAQKRSQCEGGLCHDILKHQEYILPADASKAAVAWARAAKAVQGIPAEECAQWIERATRAVTWHETVAKPLGALAYNPRVHGFDEASYEVPRQWSTQDLLMLLWAKVELLAVGEDCGEELLNLARKVVSRQVRPDEAEDGLYGHFYSFDDRSITEKAWTHHLSGGFGADLGGVYPFYVMPLMKLLKRFPKHGEAQEWRSCIERLAEGFIWPSYERSPFGIMAQGVYGDQGLMFFCGTWHGSNAIYGNTACLVSEMAELLEQPKFLDCAKANLQWLAGLNAGVTKASLQGSLLKNLDIAEDEALPCSMMYGVGHRWAGTWFATRGVICNGFSTGKQFEFDVPVSKENDGPHSFTDEDWIPHSAAWLSGLSTLRRVERSLA